MEVVVGGKKWRDTDGAPKSNGGQTRALTTFLHVEFHTCGAVGQTEIMSLSWRLEPGWSSELIDIRYSMAMSMSIELASTTIA